VVPGPAGAQGSRPDGGPWVAAQQCRVAQGSAAAWMGVVQDFFLDGSLRVVLLY
jgi:hypothetical protein